MLAVDIPYSSPRPVPSPGCSISRARGCRSNDTARSASFSAPADSAPPQATTGSAGKKRSDTPGRRLRGSKPPEVGAVDPDRAAVREGPLSQWQGRGCPVVGGSANSPLGGPAGPCPGARVRPASAGSANAHVYWSRRFPEHLQVLIVIARLLRHSLLLLRRLPPCLMAHPRSSSISTGWLAIQPRASAHIPKMPVVCGARWCSTGDLQRRARLLPLPQTTGKLPPSPRRCPRSGRTRASPYPVPPSF